MLYAKFFGGFSKSFLLSKQDDFNIGEQSPRFDGVALDRRDVRIGKGLGGGKQSNQWHGYV